MNMEAINEYGVNGCWLIRNGSTPEKQIYKYLRDNEEKYHWLNYKFLETNFITTQDRVITEVQHGNYHTYLRNTANKLIVEASKDYCIENNIVKDEEEFNEIAHKRMSEYWFFNYGTERIIPTIMCDILKHQGWKSLEHSTDAPDNCEVTENPFNDYRKIYREI